MAWTKNEPNLTNDPTYLEPRIDELTQQLDEKLNINEFENYQNDFVKHPGIATTTGAANAYVVSLDPAPVSYVDGMGIVATIHVDSTAASTLNVNDLGAVPIKKANGTNVTNLKANGVYTLRYSNGNFILQGEGASGNAIASDLLSGKTATTDAGEITGTLALTGNASTNQVLSGATFYNTNAKSKLTGTIPSKGAATITPSTVNQTIGSGQYLSGAQTILGDPDLIAANILSGKNIFGVAGSLSAGKKWASGVGYHGSNSSNPLVVTGLDFTPSIVIASSNVNPNFGAIYWEYITDNNMFWNGQYSRTTTGIFTIQVDGFTYRNPYGGYPIGDVNWVAFE